MAPLAVVLIQAVVARLETGPGDPAEAVGDPGVDNLPFAITDVPVQQVECLPILVDLALDLGDECLGGADVLDHDEVDRPIGSNPAR